MDLNYLYYRQQIELMRADEAQSGESAEAHKTLAGLFGSLIAERKEDARLPAG